MLRVNIQRNYKIKEGKLQNSNPVRQSSNHRESVAQTADRPPRKPTNRGPIGIIAFAVAILVIVFLSVTAFSIVRSQGNSSSTKADVDTNKYQAVFLTNGQVYFGKIRDITSENIKLEEVYYLQVQDSVQPSDKNKQQNLSLLKLGGEIHGPEDKMVITREQTLFWENLTDDGKVVQAINQAKKK